MNSLAVFLSPLALLLPALAAELPQSSWGGNEEVRAAPQEKARSRGFDQPAVGALRLLESARRPPVENQVRIEQRVIIRIAPSSPRVVEQSMARIAREAEDYREERSADCVPIGSIAAVYPSRENRLLLFMHDRRVLSAALERTCHAEDFYSGFYVERSDDGQLCSRRDQLQSRAGASCRVTRLNRLVARDQSRD